MVSRSASWLWMLWFGLVCVMDWFFVVEDF